MGSLSDANYLQCMQKFAIHCIKGIVLELKYFTIGEMIPV